MRVMRRAGALTLATATAAAGVLTATAAPAAAEVVEPFAKRYDESLYGDFKTIGNTVLDCPTSPAATAASCKETQQAKGTKNNNNFVERRIDTAGLTGTFDSSTGQVTIPPGARVDYARLFWGGNAGTHRFGRTVRDICDLNREGNKPVDPAPGDPLTTSPVIRVGGGAQSTVHVENAVRSPDATQGPHYYTAEADVTDAFQGAPTGSPVEVAVGNVWAPSGQGCVGGWSLTVVYKYDGPDEQYAPDRRNVYVWGGHVIQRSTKSRAAAPNGSTTVPVDGFYRTAGDIHASTTAFEGDWNTKGDRFLVDGKPVTEPHTGKTDNFFVSEDDGAVKPKYRNNLSIDAKAFEVPDGAIPVGARSAKLTFTSTGDVYVPSQLALSVPVPDLRVTKTASPTKVKPGGKLTYTVKAKNISQLPYPGARFSDDLSGNLDDATYNEDAKATTGSVSYTRPKLGYVGDIGPGETATVTYSVTVKDPVRGDGKLLNDVDVETPRSNCDKGSTDPRCAADPVLDIPRPPVTVVSSPARRTVQACGSTTNTITVRNPSRHPRVGATASWPVRPGGRPVASSGKVTEKGSRYVWQGTVPAKGKVTVTQKVKVSCTPGKVTVITVTAPGSNCAKTRRGGDDPCTSAIRATRVQGRPAPAQGHPGQRSGPRESGEERHSASDELADTGSSRTLLYGGAAAALCGLGVLVIVAARKRRD
ncbi:hypothetical protein DEJ48_21665 [Streptomyces venezuelae]|uniref:Gram-positive cocci surface proteins LPxTG domain-containing protein n=1 Tax=Streptomyces venezuelae TaxID=54571 RepID=A0A5P2C169_STRVZ|nr:DUF11 domain-containing protein [Streptomyces venezuelae]QES35678.1 hypothetical protein DEJ48_21665 [Streptomyces venezuelae]